MLTALLTAIAFILGAFAERLIWAIAFYMLFRYCARIAYRILDRLKVALRRPLQMLRTFIDTLFGGTAFFIYVLLTGRRPQHA